MSKGVPSSEPKTWTGPRYRGNAKLMSDGFTLRCKIDWFKLMSDENYNRRLRGRDLLRAYRQGRSLMRWHRRVFCRLLLSERAEAP